MFCARVEIAGKGLRVAEREQNRGVVRLPGEDLLIEIRGAGEIAVLIFGVREPLRQRRVGGVQGVERGERFFKVGLVLAQRRGKHGEPSAIDGRAQRVARQAASGDVDGLRSRAFLCGRLGPRNPRDAEIRIELDRAPVVATRPGSDGVGVRSRKWLRGGIELVRRAVHRIEHASAQLVRGDHLVARGVFHLDFEAQIAVELGEIAVNEAGGGGEVGFGRVAGAHGDHVVRADDLLGEDIRRSRCDPIQAGIAGEVFKRQNRDANRRRLRSPRARRRENQPGENGGERQRRRKKGTDRSVHGHRSKQLQQFAPGTE